jgi:hypothetical protein
VLGALFIFLAAALAGITWAAVDAAQDRPGLWAVAIPAAAITVWLALLGFRALRG